jgi:hypothetical protein
LKGEAKMEINEEKRKKFMEFAGKRVNNVMHDIQILEPMARSSAYDFTKEDVEEMFIAMQDVLNNTKAEFNKKFEEKARTERKVFSFGGSNSNTSKEVSETENKSYVSNISVNSESINLNNEIEDSIENIVETFDNNEDNDNIDVNV